MKADLGVLEVGWKSRFHCDERQVEQYRHGRVFLAGDAAHVHSPMGGQGMNTGIQDAANLAWKIDAVLDGADDAVLDSYQDERHPIGKRVLLQSGLMARGVTLHPRIARGLRNLLVPRLLRVPRVRDEVAGSFAGTTLRYAHRAGESALVGTRATQIPLMQDRLTELQREPGFVLIRENGRSPVDVTDLHQAERADPGPAVLVRPDGYIAWAGDSANRSEWLEVLARWTGLVVWAHVQRTKDQSQRHGRRARRRRDDAGHLEVDQGPADPSAPRHQTGLLRPGHRAPRRHRRPGDDRLGVCHQEARRRRQVRHDHPRRGPGQGVQPQDHVVVAQRNDPKHSGRHNFPRADHHLERAAAGSGMEEADYHRPPRFWRPVPCDELQGRPARDRDTDLHPGRRQRADRARRWCPSPKTAAS